MVKALTTHEVNSQCINNLRHSLNKVGKNAPTYINWIKAHIGHEGNELADELAKEGAEGNGNGPPIMVGSSMQ